MTFSSTRPSAASYAKVFLRRRWLLLMPYVPLAIIMGYWLGGETGLVAAALAMSGLALVPIFVRRARPELGCIDGLPERGQVIARMDESFLDAGGKVPQLACLVLQFDNADTLLDRHGRAAQTQVLQRSAERLLAACRVDDCVVRLEGGGFAVALSQKRQLDLNALVQFGARLQAVVAEPVSVGASRLFVTASVGFCQAARAPAASGAALLDAAQTAADEALRNGPGAIRVYAPEMSRKRADRDARRAELEVALDEGQIHAHFQPQISADTFELTGFETLARWYHPTKGILAPGQFLTTLNEAGLSERLSEVMLFHALVALSRWDKAGLRVPAIGVNFSNDELRNPRLADRLKWELDRFDLTPDRLCIEVLENVVSTSDNDVIVRNVTELARMGCRIDLDDFGTGHTSINNIRRFKVHRLKIDRSFVTRIDQDVDQKRVVSAILSLAERLGLDTLAEGLENNAEQTVLAQLGCGHLQGYGIARPMPFDQTLDWIPMHEAKRQQRLRNGMRFG